MGAKNVRRYYRTIRRTSHLRGVAFKGWILERIERREDWGPTKVVSWGSYSRGLPLRTWKQRGKACLLHGSSSTLCEGGALFREPQRAGLDSFPRQWHHNTGPNDKRRGHATVANVWRFPQTSADDKGGTTAYHISRALYGMP